MTNLKKIILVISILIFILLIFAVYNISSNMGKVEMDINVAPQDSKLLLDQTSYVNSGKNKITPGDHVIKATRAGFSSKTQKFTIHEEGSNLILVSLAPSDREGETYLNNHQNEFVRIGDLGELESSNAREGMIKRYPLTSRLPIDISPLFIINYGGSKKYPNDPTKIAIYISVASPKDKQLALSTIYDKGYDPSDYEIIFESLQE